MNEYLQSLKEIAASNQWSAILPEITLGVLALALLVLEVVFPAYRRRVIPRVAVAGQLLVLIGFLLFYRDGGGFLGQETFGGMLYHDQIGQVMRGFFLLTSVLVGYLATVSLLGKPVPKVEFHHILLVVTAALMFLAQSNHFVMFFIALETAAVGFYVLVAYLRYQAISLEAGLKYLILSAVGSGMILLALALMYMVTGHFNLDYIAQHLPAATESYPMNVMASLALLIVGFGVKSALFPLHVWLPDAHSSAPSPSSAVLSAVVVKVYVVVLIRLIYTIFGAGTFASTPVSTVILFIASTAIIAGSLFAIAQDDLKRMLAFSTVAQMGYIYLGMALVTENGVVGGVAHIFNHALMKSLLFLAAGAIIYQTDIRRISDMSGIAKRMPITMTVFSIGALSMIGIPGFNGFISKVYLAIGALDAGRPLYVAVILMSSLLNAVYYLPIVIKAFFGPDKEENEGYDRDRLPLTMKISLALLGTACIFFGLIPSSLLDVVRKITAQLLGI